MKGGESMQNNPRGYTDTHGRPEIVAGPEFKTGAATFRVVGRVGDDDRPDGDALTGATAAPPAVVTVR
jgi:hypothetical protein